MRKTTALIIMDGFGNNPDKKSKYDAIAQAGTPNIKALMQKYPNATLKTSGKDVGLPDGMMGNSEVGHLNIGSGRIVYQDLTAIDHDIETGDFFSNSAFLSSIENVKKNNTTLHLFGLLSTGGVHSSLSHLYSLLELAKKKDVKKLYVHAIMDGRDVQPQSGEKFLMELEDKLKNIGIGKVGVVVGRFYCMDRDNRWDRVKIAYDALFSGVGKKFDTSIDAIKDSYKDGKTDEFVQACIIGDYKGISQNDSLIFYNYRSDRAREISRAILIKDFSDFERIGGYKNVHYTGFTLYDDSFASLGMNVAFAPKQLNNTLGEYLAENGLVQSRVAETEKYAHVTFFFNGGVEKANKNENRILVPSPKVTTYDLQPEMSAYDVKDKCLQAIKDGTDVLIVNFANCDMVGHTGIIDAAKKAVATVDECVFDVVSAVLATGGDAIITADHGNAELMTYDDGVPCTSHTTFDVPIILASEKYKNEKLKDGRLADIAPTILKLLNLPKPKEMTGVSLI